MRLQSSNPVIKTVERGEYVSDQAVTYANVATKTAFLILIMAVSAFITIRYLGHLTWGLLIGAMIIGFISVIIGTRSVKLSPIFAVIYAICEGAVLGIISFMYALLVEGIVPTALLTTVIVLLVMLLLYSTGIIKVTQRFASVMVVALISVIIMSVVALIFSNFFQMSGLYFLICGVSAILSALFLLLDFESIRNCVESGADKSTGWVLSLGLLVTLVWVYIEILRLVAIFSRNRN
ncbi:MAG: Bax inhibitor-1/YccA family protein [Candidatus Izemoplasmatales bacterium]|jgi:uncharacterized YccA/Bax inhibitor family protein|nr:Bax inhibitor-1/YccA family protein [Candidatus Izemoplasmatales bacterium]NLF48645.1 Bax inhibitor-1/YccA family protein [Acholeplasmataceae bacterium]MDD4354874.1 Bax inhibitor-1/YccA family protein [Candidatus Izemoplasmatales bacterium]MDD4987720.1 Bax inhibitor-1/YccA family protein [Candidatus Izemoplasmatales bacterium]MDD5602148.1 Bax inhibitor-1/YccA family protein [Candidatus Izemoplasmatales bacterium]